MEKMSVTEELRAERVAARYEAMVAQAEYAAGLVSYEYANAALNVWDAALDRWAERVNVR